MCIRDRLMDETVLAAKELVDLGFQVMVYCTDEIDYAENLTITNNLVTVEVTNANTVELMATTSSYNSKFQSFMMRDDATNGDLVANDGIYSVVIPFQSTGLEVKFYIKSENNDAIKLDPQTAEYEFYTYSPVTSDLNIFGVNDRKLIDIRDALGRSVRQLENIPLFYIYDDGTVEHKLIIKY